MALTEEQRARLNAKAAAEIEARKQQQEEQEYYNALLAGYEEQDTSLARSNAGNIEVAENSIFMEAKTSSIESVLEAQVSLTALVPSVIWAFIIVFLLRRISVVLGVIIGSLLIGLVYLYLSHIQLSVSNRRVWGQMGFFHIERMESPLDQISNVKVEQGFLGSLFGYGTVVVSTDSSDYYFKSIKDADYFQQAVMKRIHQYKEDYATRQAVKIAMAMREAGLSVNNTNV